MVADRIEREIRIEAPIDVVWSVVTEPAQISQWFADAVDIELEVGAEGTFTVNPTSEHPSIYNMRVERVDPPHHFAYRWAYPDGVVPGPTNAPLVEFTLTEEGAQATRLTVVESGLRGLEWEEQEKERYFTSHGEGWDEKLALLREHVYQTTSR